jgi:hypothetical protein
MINDISTSNNVSQHTVLNNSSRRLCVLSSTTDEAGNNKIKDGEVRLYGANYSDLYAVIRLSSVIKVKSGYLN